MKSTFLFSALFCAFLCLFLSNAQFNDRILRGRPRRRGRIGALQKLRVLITFYRYGISLNDALRRSEVVRDVVNTLENRNLRPPPIRGKKCRALHQVTYTLLQLSHVMRL